jgi:putative copper export protein
MIYYVLLTLHVLSATIWTGGHLILSIRYLPRALKEKNADIVRQFESKYEKLGMHALALLIITGLLQGFYLLPNFGDWFKHNNYIAINLTIKLTLLILTLLLALHARLRIIPKLNNENLKLLAFHIIAVTVIAVLLVIVGVSFRYGGIL